MKKKLKNNILRAAAALLAAVLLAGLLGGCGSAEKKKINIVTTVFPLYDWVREVAGSREDVSISFLLDTGTDLHSYQPTADDLVKIASCDLFIYVGGESDEWTVDALKIQSKTGRVCLNLMEILGEAALAEEEKEGMEPEDEEEEEEAYDEHVWLSLKNAALFTDKIGEALAAIDASSAGTYRDNAKAYASKLSALEAEYKAAASSARSKILLFGDRFPFLYLTKELGLDYYAAFKGCSAETEASFDTIVFLARKLDELGLSAVLKTESSDGKLAATIVQTSQAKNQKVLTLNSLQSVTAEKVKEGVSYLQVMTDNLAVLKEALQ